MVTNVLKEIKILVVKMKIMKRLIIKEGKLSLVRRKGQHNISDKIRRKAVNYALIKICRSH